MYSHLLLVMDDQEFYGGSGAILSLGQQRAVATVVNTLVFCTHCPAATVPGCTTTAANAVAADTVLLLKWAPPLLRWVK